MAYDLHGAWDDFIGHNSPLYGRQGETGTQAELNQVRIPLTLLMLLTYSVFLKSLY